MQVNGMPVLFLYTLRDFQNFDQPLRNALAKVFFLDCMTCSCDH